ncbi:Alg9-like mannosyltransferase, partial [Clavulina sp. PMI_390]
MWYETLLDTLFFVIGAAHVILAPYTKVEESFNLHAVHDILMYGVGPGALGNYDHFTFPGVVPRSFIGSLVLAYASTPLLWSLGSFGLLRSKLQIQVAVRLVLSSLNALSLVFIRRAASKRFGSRTGTWFTLLSCSQFHVMFWMGRTLPNMFALFPVNIVIGLVLSTTKTTPHLTRRAIMILTATAVILRAELVGLVGPLALFALIRRRVSIGQLIIDGAVAGCLAIGATILVDSHFWHQAWMWPEFAGIWFNVYEGKSAEWGVSPRHAYFTSHLPKLLMASLPLSVVGAGVNSYVRQLMLVVLVFVGLLSQLGHKEWRFVVYVVPLVNVGAARGAAWILDRRPAWRMLRRLLALGLVGLIALNVCATAFLTYVSSANYPGGEAMTRLHEVIHKTQASIFIDDLAAQSGASLFTQECAPPYAFGLSP